MNIIEDPENLIVDSKIRILGLEDMILGANLEGFGAQVEDHVDQNLEDCWPQHQDFQPQDDNL